MFVIAFLLMMAPHVSSQTYNPPCYYKSPDGEFTLDFSTLRGKRFVSHGKDPLGKEYSYYFTPCNTIGDGEITINQGGSEVATFTVNQEGPTVVDLSEGAIYTAEDGYGIAINASNEIRIGDDWSNIPTLV